MNLAQKTCVFVGGFGGIGKCMCEEFLASGLKGLMVLDIMKEDEGREEIEKMSSINPDACLAYERLNLLKGPANIQSKLKSAAKKFDGTFDLLVNGSGIIKERDPKSVIGVNLLGLIDTTLLAIPIMSKSSCGRGGMIVNIASVLGLQVAPFIAVYTSTKHGVIGFTRSMADKHYFDVTGIKHIAFCPGFTTTPLIEEFEDTFEFSAPITKKYSTTVKRQTAAECGKHSVCAIQQAKNGSIWISDLGEVYEVPMHEYWKPQFESSKKC